MEPIRLRGARHNNLQGIDLDIPAGGLLVVTGPSGAGKSSLALDTLFAEGQRRYVESFSPYARQFLDRSPRPALDELSRLPPAVAVDRTAPGRGGRSTVATRTEIIDYLKLLFARAAELDCDHCGQPVVWDGPESVAHRLLAQWEHRRAVLWLPYPCRPEVTDLLAAREALLPFGLTRLLGPEGVMELEEVRPSDLARLLGEEGLRVVVDRVLLAASEKARLLESIETAMGFGQGVVAVEVDGRTVLRAARGRRCSGCGRAFAEPSPGLFSPNNPLGACPSCSGFGRTIELDQTKVIEPTLSLADNAIVPFRGKTRDWERAELARLCQRQGIPLDQPWTELSDEQRQLVWEGEGKGKNAWWGLRAWFDWMESRSYKPHVRIQLARYRAYVPCLTCEGSRFSAESLRYRLGKVNIAQFLALSVDGALRELDQWALTEDPATVLLVRQVAARLRFLAEVGLGYLTLDRPTRTLSGGEAQRVGLATVLGAELSATLFVVDEPTVGLHPGDVPRLVTAVRRLAAAGNPVVVIDNHAAFVKAADQVADLGPGAGARGGRLVYSGPPAGLARSTTSLTAALFRPSSGTRRPRRTPERWATIRAARANNLKEIDVKIPLGVLTVVTGPSGSGKSSLVQEVLVSGLRELRGEPTETPGAHGGLEGFEEVTQLVVMDQSPLGRTSRGNPATYVKAWDVLRNRLAAQKRAVELGFTASTFSFNVAGGRCETCLGEGVETVEMQFLPDLKLPCPGCGGRRFGPEALEVTLGGKNVVELLQSTVAEVLELFPEDKLLHKRLQPLAAVGLDSLRLGQPLDTLSDGEAQRLKLARALAAIEDRALVVLDEPTVGLHPADVDHLLAVFQDLVARGSTVLIVEHDMQVAAAADWLMDLGPGAGEAGGEVVAQGTPEAVAQAGAGATAPFLARVLSGEPAIRLADVAERRADYARSQEQVRVRGARHHNLKNITVDLPRGKFCVVTGPSGSGKSTLAFDVIHAEGQRRYLESLSPFVRQYLHQLPRPEVDQIQGLPPSIALEPRNAGAPGATVATLTEVGHFLRLLYARVGAQRCPACQVSVTSRNPEDIIKEIHRLVARVPGAVLARLIHHRKGTHRDVWTRARALGLERVRADGIFWSSNEPARLDRYQEHDLDLEVAQISRATSSETLEAVVAEALRLGRGTLRLLLEDGSEHLLSTHRSCPSCGQGFPALDPTLFSPHTRQGACPACAGKGWETSLDEVAAFVPGVPLAEGGLKALLLPTFRRRWGRRLQRLTSLPLSRPWEELTPSQRQSVLEGRGKWPGLLTALLALSEQGSAEAAAMLTTVPCRACQGTRLGPLPRNVRLGETAEPGASGRTLPEVMALSIERAREWFEQLRLTAREQSIGQDLRREVLRRLDFLQQSGVGYLSLDRDADTLSGGETQRVRLAAQLGAGLMGACYVLDEPTIGLHPRDTDRLIDIFRQLARHGSTLLVVEHDEQTIRAADHVLDLGPRGGQAGGRVVAQGSPAVIEATEDSPTGQALAAARVPSDVARRDLSHASWLVLRGAASHNLQGIDVSFPLARLVAVTGVSGSGKSTLVRETLWRAVRRQLQLTAPTPGTYRALEGVEAVHRAIEVDQGPIGRTSRSVPATYLGIWDDIRRLLAQTPEARARGYGAERFSFNVAGGRCESCGGQGEIKVEMSFLPQVRARCEACGGTRFESNTREVTYRGLSVDRILALTAEEAAQVFGAFPRIASPLSWLCELGLGSLTLGQPSNTLSGGEAQRLKLCAELHTRTNVPTLYVLDEPTTGLHLFDVDRLIGVLQQLVDRGHTVLVIEHHPKVFWAADYLIDLGPEGGEQGGTVVAAGSPLEVLDHPTSHTARALREWLGRGTTPLRCGSSSSRDLGQQPECR